MLVGYEMGWTHRFYLRQADQWSQRANMAAGRNHRGAMAYALRKAGMWRDIALSVRTLFIAVNPNFRTL